MKDREKNDYCTSERAKHKQPQEYKATQISNSHKSEKNKEGQTNLTIQYAKENEKNNSNSTDQLFSANCSRGNIRKYIFC